MLVCGEFVELNVGFMSNCGNFVVLFVGCDDLILYFVVIVLLVICDNGFSVGIVVDLFM